MTCPKTKQLKRTPIHNAKLLAGKYPTHLRKLENQSASARIPNLSSQKAMKFGHTTSKNTQIQTTHLARANVFSTPQFCDCPKNCNPRRRFTSLCDLARDTRMSTPCG